MSGNRKRLLNMVSQISADLSFHLSKPEDSVGYWTNRGSISDNGAASSASVCYTQIGYMPLFIIWLFFFFFFFLCSSFTQPLNLRCCSCLLFQTHNYTLYGITQMLLIPEPNKVDSTFVPGMSWGFVFYPLSKPASCLAGKSISDFNPFWNIKTYEAVSFVVIKTFSNKNHDL